MTLIDRRLLVARTGRWQWYWGLLGLAAVLSATVSIASVLFAFVELWPAGSYWLGLQVSEDLILSPGRWDTFASFIVSSVPPILATIVTIKWVHGWSFGMVAGPGGRFAWGHFCKAAMAVFAIYVIGTVIDFGTDPARYVWQARRWDVVFWIVLAGVVILPQAFSEDFLFNGYLMRLWGAVVPIRFVVPIVLSVLFSLVHAWNADVAKDPLPSLAALFGGQLLALLIYVRTGSLGATVGLHWMNNAFLAGLIATEPGYKNDLALVIYRDPVLSKGGTYLYDPWSWLSLAVGLWIVWLCLSWRRSPFYIPDRCDVPPEIEHAVLGDATGEGATGAAASRCAIRPSAPSASADGAGATASAAQSKDEPA